MIGDMETFGCRCKSILCFKTGSIFTERTVLRHQKELVLWTSSLSCQETSRTFTLCPPRARRRGGFTIVSTSMECVREGGLVEGEVPTAIGSWRQVKQHKIVVDAALRETMSTCKSTCRATGFLLPRRLKSRQD